MEIQAKPINENGMNKKTTVQLAGLLAAAFCLPVQAEERPQASLNDNMETETNMNDELVKKANEAITRLRNEGYSCSQATFLGLCRALGSELTEKQLKALSAGFRGGIGKTYEDGTCGALSAGIMALGLYTADDNDKGIALAGKLFKHFKDTYGTVKCGDIVGQYQFTRCTGCCLCMGEKVVELLQREKVELPQANAVTWDKAVQSKLQEQ